MLMDVDRADEAHGVKTCLRVVIGIPLAIVFFILIVPTVITAHDTYFPTDGKAPSLPEYDPVMRGLLILFLGTASISAFRFALGKKFGVPEALAIVSIIAMFALVLILGISV